MTNAPEALILDLVEWISGGPRPYADAIDRWRTSCPRLTVWEDAMDAGYIVRSRTKDTDETVDVTPEGRAFLQAHGR